MLNRIAESLFWIGRYTERGENHARLIDVYYHLRDESGEEKASVWRRIVEAIGDRAAYEERHGAYTERDVIRFLTLDSAQPNSLIACIALARDNLRKIRDRLPSELWNSLNGFYLWLRQVSAEEVEAEPHRFFERVKEGLAAYQGTAVSIVLRDESWYMMEIGRYLERADNVSRLLRSACHTFSATGIPSYAYLLALLKSAGGHEAYRRLGSGDVTPEGVAGFLLLRDSFPRSVYYSLSSLENGLKALRFQAEGIGSAVNRVIRLAGKARLELSWLEPDDLTFETLAAVYPQLLDRSRLLGEEMAKAFFSSEREVIA